jgi:hypothetical protein
VGLLLLWILDYLGMLEVVSAFLELIGAVIAGAIRLVAYLIRRLTTSSKPES